MNNECNKIKKKKLKQSEKSFSHSKKFKQSETHTSQAQENRFKQPETSFTQVQENEFKQSETTPSSQPQRIRIKQSETHSSQTQENRFNQPETSFSHPQENNLKQSETTPSSQPQGIRNKQPETSFSHLQEYNLKQSKTTPSSQPQRIRINQPETSFSQPLENTFNQSETPSSRPLEASRILAIVPVNYPSGLFNKYSFDMVSRDLSLVLSNLNGELPTFDEWSLQKGTIIVSCTNHYSKTWIENIFSKHRHKVNTIPIPQNILHINTVETILFNYYYSDKLYLKPHFFKLLEGQNKGLKTNNWVPINNSKIMENNQMKNTFCRYKQSFFIDEQSLDYIMKAKMKLHLGMEKIIFSVLPSEENQQEKKN